MSGPQYSAYGPGTMPYSNGGVPGTYSSNIMGGPGTNGTSFAFKKRFERVDWRKIAAVDVESISRNLDFNTLQENIMNITFCNIESEMDVRTIDPNFVKLFKLAQLTIEYLLHSQDYLSGMVGGLEEKLKKAMEEHEETKKDMEKQKQELADVRKESHKRKKMLMAQQQLLNAGTNSYHKCPYCPKAFVNGTFLQSHLTRRHAEASTPYTAAPISQPQHQVAAESQGQIASMNKAMEKEIGDIRERLRLTESQLVEERNSRNSMAHKTQSMSLKRDREMQLEMEQWKQDQLESQKKEMDSIRDMFMKELREMNEKYQASEQALQDLHRKYVGRSSNLGSMQDDMAEERKLILQQREELAMMKEQVQSEVGNIEENMQSKLEEQEKRWQEKLKSMNKKHRSEVEKLSGALEDSITKLQEERESEGNAATDYEKQMKALVQQSREQEKRLQEREKQLERLSRQPPKTAPRQPKIKHSQISQSGGAKSPSKMDPPSDDDDDDDDEDEVSEFGTTSLTSTYPFGSATQSTVGSLENTSTRLHEQLKKDPKLLQAIKEELSGILNAELEKRGVKRNAAGLSVAALEDKLGVMKTERQQAAKKFSNFYDIRQFYITQVDELAKAKIKEQKATRASQREQSSRSAPTTPVKSRQRSQSESDGRSQGKNDPPPRTPSKQQASYSKGSPTHSRHTPTTSTHQRQAPKPAPRAASPQGKMMNTMSTVSSAQFSQSLTGTVTSSTWSDNDDDMLDGPPGGMAVSGGMNRRGPARVSFEDDEEESDWDDASELQEMSPNRVTSGSKKIDQRAIRGSPQPKGKMVEELTRSIEFQLQNRGKKPVGGKNTMDLSDGEEDRRDVRKSHVNDFDYEDDEEDDDFSVSSLEDDLAAVPAKGIMRKSVSKSNTYGGETDYSTNTYGTSVWGNSSKDPPQPSPRRSQPRRSDTSGGNPSSQTSAARSSVVTVSDFDDSDLDDI